MKQESLLIELGTEELPPKALKKLSESFSHELLSGLIEAELISDVEAALAKPYATPRRLALWVPSTLAGQPDQQVERRGPAVQAAFDKDGNATPAALGFAKSCGVDIDQLDRLKTNKGEWLCFTIKQNGQTIAELIPTIIDQAIKRLPIPKRMRWGNGSAEFVRPVKWLIVMHGATTLPTEVLNVPSGNITRGHRFHSQGELIIEHADNYESSLKEDGQIVPCFASRQSMITEQVAKIAIENNEFFKHYFHKIRVAVSWVAY